MNIQDSWEKALKRTEIVRPRVTPLETYAATIVPYTFLAESSINIGDTVVRNGEVSVEKPSIVLPFNLPQFEGFQFEEDLKVNEDLLKSFFLVRGISFPSFKYNNRTSSVDIYEGKLSQAVEHFARQHHEKEDVNSGVIVGPEDAWQFSVLIFVCSQMARSAGNDVKRLFDDMKRFGELS
jgi:hypothetical protein